MRQIGCQRRNCPSYGGRGFAVVYLNPLPYILAHDGVLRLSNFFSEKKIIAHAGDAAQARKRKPDSQRSLYMGERTRVIFAFAKSRFIILISKKTLASHFRWEENENSKNGEILKYLTRSSNGAVHNIQEPVTKATGVSTKITRILTKINSL